MLDLTAFDNICLGKDELVVTSDGLKPISEIAIGDKVLTHRGRFCNVLKTYESNNENGELLRLKSYGSGYDVKVTKNHPIWVKKANTWEFIPANQVAIGDIVGKPVITEAPKYTGAIPLTTDIAKIIGYYLSEGCYSKGHRNSNRVSFYFDYAEEETLVDELVDALKASGFKANLYYGETALRVDSYGAIATWLYQNFGHLAHAKYIPMWLLDQGEEFLSEVLQAYIEGDGYIYREVYYRATTVSPNLAYGISLIANKLGYKCSLNEQQKNPIGTIQGRTVSIRNVWDILIHKAPILKQKVWIEDGIQCARIKEIESVPYDDDSVYNLEVDMDNTFVTPAMTVHNCHEHLEYYSLGVVHNLFTECGLEIIDLEYNDVNGGSARLYVAHTGYRPVNSTVQTALDYEQTKLRSGALEEFALNIAIAKNTLLDVLKTVEKPIAVLGASTKGNTLLQYFNLNFTIIDHAAEVNKDKFGLVTVGTNIPIISEKESLKSHPTAYLVLPWHFIDTFVKKLDSYLEDGGKLIVPLPKPAVYYKEGGEVKWEYL